MAWLKARILPLWIIIIFGFAGQPWGRAAPIAKPRPASQTAPGTHGPQSGKPLIGVATHAADALVYTVQLPGSQILPSLLWSADGHHLYALEKAGTLHKIAVPSFKEELTLKTGQSCNSMALSQVGLVLGLPAAHQVWLLNVNSLAVLKKISVPGVQEGLASAPTLSTAYASAVPAMLSVIDLKAGKVTQRISPAAMAQASGGRIKQPAPAPLRFDFHLPTVSPDGKYFFCVSDASADNVFGTLQRFRIRQNELKAEEIGPIIGRNPQRIEISSDSSYVALPSRSGNLAQSYATTIYRVDDLAHPVTKITSGTYPHALAFDRAAGKIYAHNLSEQLLVFSVAGTLEHGYQLGGDASEVRQILASSSGHSVLVLTEKGLFWVVLPNSSDTATQQPLTVASDAARPAAPQPVTASADWLGTGGWSGTSHKVTLQPWAYPITGSATPISGGVNAIPRVNGSVNTWTRVSGSVDMEIMVDGIDHVHIQGHSIWLTHHAWDLPCCVKINGKERNLTWVNNVSGKWDDLAVPLPASGTLKSAITVGQTAGPVTLEQAPQASNAYEAIIQLDDGVPHGAHPYAFTFSWQTVPDTTTSNR